MMEHDDRYQSWKQQRAATSVPSEFADRVMAVIHERERQRTEKKLWLVVVLSSRSSRIGICTLASLACILRVLALAALFLPF